MTGPDRQRLEVDRDEIVRLGNALADIGPRMRALREQLHDLSVMFAAAMRDLADLIEQAQHWAEAADGADATSTIDP